MCWHWTRVLRGNAEAGMAAVAHRVAAAIVQARHPGLRKPAATAASAIEHAREWGRSNNDAPRLQARARRLVMTLGRALELALLVEHAQWQLDVDNDADGVAAARRFAAGPVDMLIDADPEDAATLL